MLGGRGGGGGGGGRGRWLFSDLEAVCSLQPPSSEV